MFIEQLSEELDQARTDLKASSCTFYVRDSHWSDEFRLVSHSGVLMEEPLYGFASPRSALKIIAEGEFEIFSTDTEDDERFREASLDVDEISESARYLFGDFVQREGIKSSARLIHCNEAGEREAVFFVNFAERIEFDETLKSKIREIFSKLTALKDDLQSELNTQDAEWLSEASRIVSPDRSVVKTDFYPLDDPSAYFIALIKAALKALKIKEGTGLGTIQLYNPEEQTLNLVGHAGDFHHLDEAQKHSVRNGRGIVSWVARMKRALLIQDLDKSHFKDIHVSLNDDTKCELAVPLEAEGELIGLMCLECTEADSFLPHHVRSLWYAANDAAIAYQLHQHASMNRKLLTLCCQATVGELGARASLNDMAKLAKDYLKASFCDLWRYNAHTHQFDSSGASYEEFDPQSRPNGWTQFVQTKMCPIWITDIENVRNYSVYHWIENEWREGVPDKTYPDELNPAPVNQGILSELAIPIVVHGKCIGVAWVKYKRKGLERPKPGLMSLALGFVAEAGLVLDSIERRGLDIINDVGEAITAAIDSRWNSEPCQILDAAVRSVPFESRLGGDFYSRKMIDENTVGILLVDGEGHGVPGSLHMLPIMTAFESSWDSYSTAHVISQLMKTSNAVGVRGSAIYCIFSLIADKKEGDKRWLCVTRAGHESLLVFQKGAAGHWEVKNFPKSPGLILGHPRNEPLIDHRLELSAGDIIVGYTDGLADQREAFDSTSIMEIVSGSLKTEHGQDPGVIAEAIMVQAARQHKGGFKDDATVFVVQVK
jgi:GAF domain-containing protein